MPDEIKVSLSGLDQMSARIDKGPNQVLKKIALVMVRESKDAFSKQAFGSIKWKERYPNQPSQKLNIAGALMDLAKGPRIK